MYSILYYFTLKIVLKLDCSVHLDFILYHGKVPADAVNSSVKGIGTVPLY